MNEAVTFFIPALNGGGAQKVVVTLANAMIDLTDRPVHIVLARAEGEFIGNVRSEVEIVDLGKSRASHSIFALAKYLRQRRPTVLCSTLNYANVCAVIAWRIAGRPCRLVLRESNVVRKPVGSVSTQLRGHMMQYLMSALYSEADVVVALGDAVAQTLRDNDICHQEIINVIPNPIDLTSFEVPSMHKKEVQQMSQRKYICAVGRLSEAKGFDVLIRAFDILQTHDLELVILGEGPLRGELESLSRELGLENRIHLPGFVQNPRSVVSQSQLFVLPSRWEGFPNALLEALATGVPIVCSDCAGEIRAIMNDGALGHLVPPEDPQALAEAIREALILPQGTREERVARANNFSAPIIAQQYLEQAFALEKSAPQRN